MKYCKALLVAVLISTSAMTSANDDFFADIDVSEEKPASIDRQWLYKGFVQQKLKYGIDVPDQNFAFERDKEGSTQVQTDIYGEVSGNLSDNVSLRLSAKAEVDALEWQNGSQEWQANHEKFFLKDAFFDVVFAGEHWLRLGHQIFAWGESEFLTISDVLSLADQREFGQAELRDIREQVPAILYSFPFLAGKLSLVGTWDAGHNRYADVSEEFYPYIALKDSGIDIVTLDPEEDWEAALRYERFFNGGDLRIVVADTNDNELSFANVALGSEEVQLIQARVQTFAISGNRVHESWQFKAELGMHWGVNITQPFAEPLEEDQFRGMLGVEYSGITDWVLSFELNTLQGVEVEPIDNVAAVTTEKTDSIGQVWHIQQTALNDKFMQHFWYFDLIEDNGSVFRWDGEYELNDTWTLSSALVLYNNDNELSGLYPFRNNDTVNFSVTFNF